MKKYLFLILTFLLLIPINVFAGTCDPDKISIESVTLESLIGNASEKEDASVNGKSINLNLHMQDIGDAAEYNIKVKNDSDSDYELNKSSINLNSDYIEYEIITKDNSIIIPAKDSKDVHLRVQYKEEVPLDVLSEGKYVDNSRMDVSITSSEKEPEPTISPVPIDSGDVEVPNTFASSKIIYLVLLILFFGITGYYYRKNKYVLLSLLVLGTAIIISTNSSFALCSTSINVESKIEIEIGYAIFKSGQEVNARMKQFVSPDATYQSVDTTIERIVRFTEAPDVSNLVEENIVSTEESREPIYLWYDSEAKTIYWYSESSDINYGEDSSWFYSGLRNLKSISNIDDIGSKNVINMSHMFNYAGYNSEEFTLDLGDNFDTSNVTNMSRMFTYAGYRSTVFTLDFGDNFNTAKVTDMSNMFQSTGYSSTVFTLDLGDSFDTSSVTKMGSMFNCTGHNSPIFTLDLGDNFDTGNVTTMGMMFSGTGYSSTVFTLDLGDKFDTKNVTVMTMLFAGTGHSSPIFTLDLGDKFDTSNVTSMANMFLGLGGTNPTFTLDLGDKFDTSKVTSMAGMFADTGFNSTIFTLDLGDKFDTSNVTDMNGMFKESGYSNESFTIDLGEKFNTSKVVNMYEMFKDSRYLTTIYAPQTFVTTSVTKSTNMFSGCVNLVGGMGTTYDSSHVDKGYAHLDGGTSNPGYFTDRSVLDSEF